MRWTKDFMKPQIWIRPSGAISKRTLCWSMAAQVLLSIWLRVFSGCASFHALTSQRKSWSNVQVCQGGDGDNGGVIGKDFCEEAGLGVQGLLDARLGCRRLRIESRSAVQITVVLITSLTCLGLLSGPLALPGFAFSFAFWMNWTAFLEKGLSSWLGMDVHNLAVPDTTGGKLLTKNTWGSVDAQTSANLVIRNNG